MSTSFLSLPVNEQMAIASKSLLTQQRIAREEYPKSFPNNREEVKKFLENITIDQNKQKRGLLIILPYGSCIWKWMLQLSEEEQKVWLNGDNLLSEEDIKNSYCFWYEKQYGYERRTIIKTFEKYLVAGFNILCYGNPLLMQSDVMILPTREYRWRSLDENQEIGSWKLSKQDFDQEEKFYKEARKTIPHLITSTVSIPSPGYIVKSMKKIRSKHV